MKKLLILTFILPFIVIAQEQSRTELDSLLKASDDKTLTDSSRAEAMYGAITEIKKVNPDSFGVLLNKLIVFGKDKKSNVAKALSNRAIAYSHYKNQVMDSTEIYFNKCIEFAEKENMYLTLYRAYYNLLFVYFNTGELDKGEKVTLKAIEAADKANMKTEKASALQQLGNVYQTMGEASKALDVLQQALDISVEINDKLMHAYVQGTLSNLYYRQGETDKALDYALKTIKELEELQALGPLAKSYGTLGMIYNYKKEHDLADEANKKAIAIFKQIGDINNAGIALMNVGIGQAERGNYSDGISKIKDAHNILKNGGDAWPLNSSMKLMGIAYSHAKDYKNSSDWCLQALKHSQEVGILSLQLDNLECVSQAFLNQKKFKEALKYYKEYQAVKDSLYNEKRTKDFAKQEAQYEYEKQKAIDDKEHEKQLAIEQEAKEKQRVITYATAGGLGLVGIFLIFVFNRLQVTKRQKNIIEEQKQEVEEQKQIVETAHHELAEKNQEILDSINYAKRIQTAILPPQKVVKEYLQESFILYKPKDIVAGDFYWLEHKEDKVMFAACDCTGHGVPGAMVSVVCNNGLNRSVREYNLTDPGKILDKTREIVIQEFEKSEEEVKDGMDIALCTLQGNTLHYAGANNPLWIIRTNSHEIEEIKADKQPIGKYAEPTPYTTHQIELQKGDMIYIFSDGYADQFGGEKGKKFKAANFKKLLLSIQNKTIEQQREIINQAFEDWKGDLEQLDDVCIIGVRI